MMGAHSDPAAPSSQAWHGCRLLRVHRCRHDAFGVLAFGMLAWPLQTPQTGCLLERFGRTEQGRRIREQGARRTEQGERGTGRRTEQGAGSRAQGAGAGSREQGAGRTEQGAGSRGARSGKPHTTRLGTALGTASVLQTAVLRGAAPERSCTPYSCLLECMKPKHNKLTV